MTVLKENCVRGHLRMAVYAPEGYSNRRVPLDSASIEARIDSKYLSLGKTTWSKRIGSMTVVQVWIFTASRSDTFLLLGNYQEG